MFQRSNVQFHEATADRAIRVVEILGGNVASRRKALIGSYFPPPATLRTRSMHMHTRAFSANSWIRAITRWPPPTRGIKPAATCIDTPIFAYPKRGTNRSTTPAFLPRGKNYSCPFVFLFFVSNWFGARTTLVNRAAASKSAKGKLVDARGTRQMRGDERS